MKDEASSQFLQESQSDKIEQKSQSCCLIAALCKFFTSKNHDDFNKETRTTYSAIEATNTPPPSPSRNLSPSSI